MKTYKCEKHELAIIYHHEIVCPICIEKEIMLEEIENLERKLEEESQALEDCNEACDKMEEIVERHQKASSEALNTWRNLIHI